MNFYFLMVNAWSLAASILGGTFDEDYPLMKQKKNFENGNFLRQCRTATIAAEAAPTLQL